MPLVSSSLNQLTAAVAGGNHLTPAAAAAAVEQLVSAEVEVTVKADFLASLAAKGETAEEIAAFAQGLRERSTPVPVSDRVRVGDILDVCGTGGDRLNTFNISTTVALVASAAGVVVAKHGNRAITSRSGSADVLEALGIRIDLSPEEAGVWLERHQFAFLFAPRFHPAFKQIGPARALCNERGQRTIFNLIGPLLNPARATVQLMGVPAPRFCGPMAKVLQSLGVRRAMVVSGNVPLPASEGTPSTAWLDEWSILGPTHVAEFYQPSGFSESEIAPGDFPVGAATLQGLSGGDREENARLIEAIFRRTETGARRDAVLLNAAAALFVAGRCSSMGEGWDLAAATLDDGVALRKLEELRAVSRGS